MAFLSWAKQLGQLAALTVSAVALSCSLWTAATAAAGSGRPTVWKPAPPKGTRAYAPHFRWSGARQEPPAAVSPRFHYTSFRDDGSGGPPAAAARGAPVVWRKHDIGPAVQRLDATADRDLLAVWVHEFAALELSSARSAKVVVDGDKLLVRGTPAVQRVVERLVSQLNRSPADHVVVHLQITDAVDPSWRRSLLRDIGLPRTGPDGQMLWQMTTGQSNVLRAELAAQRRRTADIVAGSYQLRHGVPAVIEYTLPVPYVKGIQPDRSATLPGYAPVMDQVEQGLKLVLLPVWRDDLTGVDLLCRAELRSVRRITSVNTTLQVPGGAQPVSVHVPEVQSVRWQVAIPWRAARTVVMSLGIHPSLQTSPPTGSLPALTRPAGEVLVIASLRPPLQTARRVQPSAGGWRRR